MKRAGPNKRDAEKSPMLGYLAADDHDRPRWDLFVYLVGSYALTYAVHLPMFDRWDRALIPAAIPWGIAAAVAFWQYRHGLPRLPAWVTLAIATSVFVGLHILH